MPQNKTPDISTAVHEKPRHALQRMSTQQNQMNTSESWYLLALENKGKLTLPWQLAACVYMTRRKIDCRNV